MEEKEGHIAVVGIGCSFPGGEGLDNFWNILLEGKNCTVPIPNERFNSAYWYDPDNSKPGKTHTMKAALMDGFNELDHRLFGISDAEADHMDPQQKVLLQCTYRALESAGLPMEKASGSRTGVFLGLMNKDYELTTVQHNPGLLNHWAGTGKAMSIAANRISYTFNLTGPSLAIDSACSSSLVALHLACQAIRQGDCEMALCGGVSCLIEPQVFVALSKAKMISPEGTSKPFSSRADGYGRGEGCGIVLLKPLKQALRDCDYVWGIISKTAVNQDGRTVTPITKPSMIQQQELLRRIYSESDLSDVQYIEAHGTGTPVGDPIEAGSISKVIATARPLGSETLRIGSVKGNIGHTESAAGVAGLIKVLLMMKHETIVPSVFYSEDNASIDAKALNVKVPTKAEKWSNSVRKVAGINNFGFGGTNAHTIVKQYDQSPTSVAKVNRSHEYFVLSAASERSLTMMIEDTVKQIGAENKVKVDLQNVTYTSACRRGHLKNKYRKAFITSSLPDLKNQLKSALDKKLTPSKLDPRLVFVFCGNGVTYRGMGKQLLREEPVFREKVREVEALFQRYQTMSIIGKLESESSVNDDFSKPDVVQPLLFAIQVGIASLLKHWGVKPDAVLGHSVGEVAAAHCSGLLSLDDAVKVIYYRSSLQSKVTGGKMLVVSNMAVSDVLKCLPVYSGKICMAAYNSPQSCTLSGDADAVDRLHQKLSSSDKNKTLFLHALAVPAAYHSQMMDPILSQIEDSIGSLQVNETETELFSTVTGKEAEQPDFSTGKYWARNIREPVAFEQAVRSAAKEKKNVVFVEIGPKRALQRYITETLENDITVLSSAQPDKDHETILAVISKLFELGVQIDWDQFYRGCETPPTPFPRYQFDCVKKDIIFEAAQKGTSSSHPVLAQTGNDGRTFSCDLSSTSVSYLQDHRNNDVAIIPGALYAELGLAAFMASAKPKVPLSTLQLSVSFQSPFLLTPHSPEMSVKLDPTGNETKFMIQSPIATYASGSITCEPGRVAEEQYISIDTVYKRCTSTMNTEEFYNYLSLRGFQYGSVFRNKGNVHYGDDLMEAICAVTVHEDLLPQLHDFCIHPVVLDYLLQLTPVTISNTFMARPGFPAEIGSLTVHEPLQPEMTLYLRAANVAPDHFEVSGCFTDKAGRVLVELKHVIIKYLGSQSLVVEEYFLHNEFHVISTDSQPTQSPKALVFADQLGVTKAMQKHLSPKSTYISVAHAKDLLSHGFKSLLSKFNISDMVSTFEEILFLWGFENVTSHKTEPVLQSMVSCCETFRQIVLELKAMKFKNSIRAITYRSAETTVDHISPGFVLSGMTRSCAAEMADLSFQLIDINSTSTEDIRALSQVLSSYPCSKYPELVVKDGQVLQPYIVHTPHENIHTEGNIHSLKSPQYVLQTADPYRMVSLSAIPCNDDSNHIQGKSIEVQLNKLCVHTSDYCPVSVSDLKFDQTMYWNKQTSQNHNLLALDFSGTVTAVGKDVSKLKVGDQIVSCYPITATSRLVIPEAACYNTKRFPFLREIPCVSYFVLAWEILHRVLPKVKQQKRMAMISSVPDSGLMKVLVHTANKSGWNAMVLPQLSDQLQNVNKFDALILLPPFDKSQFATACGVPGVTHIVSVCENQEQSSISQNVFRDGNDNVCIHTVQMSSVLDKGCVRAERPHIHRWLKSMHLDKKSLDLMATTFQRVTSGSIDFLPIEESESYFSSKTLPVVALHHDAKSLLSDIPLLPKPNQLFRTNAVYIVTGGLTGLGFETVKFIAQRGGGNIVILSRSSPSPDLQSEIHNIMNQCGAAVVSLQCDVSISTQVVKTVQIIEQSFPSCTIRGVFHSAVVLHDGLIGTLDQSLYEKVLKPKVNGALNLHHATRHCKLDYFVCFSSISAFIGNASQTNYCAANSFLDTFCQYRRNIGLPGQSINWGALNLGLLLNKDHFQRFLAAKGMMVMEVAEILESLEQCLLLNRPQQAVCKFSFKNLRQHVLTQNASLNMRLGALVEEGLKKGKSLEARDDQTTVSQSPSEYVRSVLKETTGLENDELNDDSSLSALGIDSMLAMTLQNVIFQDRGVNVPLVKLLDPSSTLTTLVKILKESEKKEVNDLSTVL